MLLLRYFFIFSILTLITIPAGHDISGFHLDDNGTSIDEKKYYNDNCTYFDSDASITKSEMESFDIQASFKGTTKLDTDTTLGITLQGNAEKAKPTLNLNTEKIVITKYYNEKDPIIELKATSSDGITIPKIKDIIASDFYISGKTIGSIAADKITPVVKLHVTHENEEKNVCHVFIDNEIPTNSFGKYTGKFTIITENFEPKQVDVEYKIQHSPGGLMLYTAIGVVFSVALGAAIIKFDNAKKTRDTTAKNKVILEHLNIHVEQFNLLEKDDRKNSGLIAYHKIQVKWVKSFLTRHPDGDPPQDRITAQSVLVVDKIPTGKLEDILKHYEVFVNIRHDFDPALNTNFLELFPVEKKSNATETDLHDKIEEDYQNFERDDIKPLIIEFKNNIDTILAVDKTNDDKSITNEMQARAGITFVIALFVYLISIPTTLFSAAYFTGQPFFDALFAIGIGFTIYRTKEIGKIIQGKI